MSIALLWRWTRSRSSPTSCLAVARKTLFPASYTCSKTRSIKDEEAASFNVSIPLNTATPCLSPRRSSHRQSAGGAGPFQSIGGSGPFLQKTTTFACSSWAMLQGPLEGEAAEHSQDLRQPVSK